MRIRAAVPTRMIRFLLLFVYIAYAGSPLTCALHDGNLVNQDKLLKVEMFLVSKLMKTAHFCTHTAKAEEGPALSAEGDDSFFVQKREAFRRNIYPLLLMICSALYGVVRLLFRAAPSTLFFSRQGRRPRSSAASAGYRRFFSGISPPFAYLS